MKWQLIRTNSYLGKWNGVVCGANLIGHTHIAANKTSWSLFEAALDSLLLWSWYRKTDLLAWINHTNCTKHGVCRRHCQSCPMHTNHTQLEIRNNQRTIKHNFIKLFIQPHVSTPWGRHQAGFQNALKEVYVPHYGSKIPLLTIMLTITIFL